MTFKLFTIGGIDIRCGIFVPFIVLLSIIFGYLQILLIAVLSLSLHELCHAVCARLMYVRIESIEIQPIGLTCRCANTLRVPYFDEMTIAAAGPLFSLLTGVGAVALLRIMPASAYLHNFAVFNIAAGVVNLIPAVPLDGGRILKTLLSVFLLPKTTLRVCTVISIIIALGFIVFEAIMLCMNSGNLTVLLMGIFLLIAAFAEMKSANSQLMQSLLKRDELIRRGARVRVRTHVMRESVPLSQAFGRMSSKAYNVIAVVDDELCRIGEIDEGRLIDAIERRGGETRLGELL